MMALEQMGVVTTAIRNLTRSSTVRALSGCTRTGAVGMHGGKGSTGADGGRRGATAETCREERLGGGIGRAEAGRAGITRGASGRIRSDQQRSERESQTGSDWSGWSDWRDWRDVDW